MLGDGLRAGLRHRLIGEGLADGMHLLVRAENGAVRVPIMTAEPGRLGMLLAAVSDPADLQQTAWERAEHD